MKDWKIDYNLRYHNRTAVDLTTTTALFPNTEHVLLVHLKVADIIILSGAGIVVDHSHLGLLKYIRIRSISFQAAPS